MYVPGLPFLNQPRCVKWRSFRWSLFLLIRLSNASRDTFSWTSPFDKPTLPYSEMFWYQVFQDGPEYEARQKKSTFTPPNLTLKDVHDAVPRHLFVKSTFKSLFYVMRHLVITLLLYLFATRIDVFVNLIANGEDIGTVFMRRLVRATLWILYFGWQGIAFAGIWCLGVCRCDDFIIRAFLIFEFGLRTWSASEDDD